MANTTFATMHCLWPHAAANDFAAREAKMNSIRSTGASKWEQPASNRMAFSIQETAEQLGVCPASVYRALKRGELEAVMLGGRRLIPRHSIEKLLAANTLT
jgi:excisionase family DNA binding protein